jgi:hypothetical protein
MTAVFTFLTGTELGRGLLIAGAAIGAFFYFQHQAYERGYADANQKAEERTERAINELANEADQARLRRRLCLDRGGVWSFANNECIKT